MQIVLLTGILACSFPELSGKEPQIPDDGVLPFMVYFESRVRGVCAGVLVSRMVVLTAAVCVVSIHNNYLNDRRPINVITGTRYRHPMRGIKVQVNRILIPKMANDTGTRSYLMQKSVALLILQRKVPDILTEEPLRAIGVDYKGEDKLTLQDECIMVGWHFFYQGDVIYPVKKFVLQRHMRYQVLNLVNKEIYCDTLVLKYEKATDNLGHAGAFVKNDVYCLRDGTYGAPLICGSGRVVGMMMAPDAQWSNCTGFSVMAHILSNRQNAKFFSCLSPLFEPEYTVNWDKLKESNKDTYDEEEAAINKMYDGVITDFETSSEEL